MHHPPFSILVVDDEESIAFAFQRYFQKRGFAVETAPTIRAALAALERISPVMVFLDVRLPDGDGLSALERIRRRPNPPPVAIMTAYGTLDIVARALALQACDYVVKPVDLSQAEALVMQALQHQSTAVTPAAGEPEIEPHSGTLLGQSPVMQHLFRRIGMVAPTAAAVLITGETGTGKELTARAVHDLSPRREAPFIAVNCAALPENLIESELFGHVRGAFTGAVMDKVGRCEAAQGGTLFLDEIGELPAATQVKLLRFLDNQCIERVGSITPIPLDVRVVAATNRHLPDAISAGRFRSDLYYRLAVIQIHLPPLRERDGDVLLLARHFLRRFANRPEAILADETESLLVRHPWPGNVRELRNAIEHAVVIAGTHPVAPLHLPQSLTSTALPTPETATAEQLAEALVLTISREVAGAALHPRAMELVERHLLLHALARVDGNQSAAAELLGLHRNTLRQKMRELGMEKG